MRKFYSNEKIEVKSGDILFESNELLLIKKTIIQQYNSLKRQIKKGGDIYNMKKKVKELEDCENALKKMPNYIEGESDFGFPKKD